MLYAIWHKDYDYAGFSIVEGPEEANIEDLQKEFRKAIRKSSEFEKYYNEQYSSHEVSPTAAFANWLVANKGFSRPKVKVVE